MTKEGIDQTVSIVAGEESGDGGFEELLNLEETSSESSQEGEGTEGMAASEGEGAEGAGTTEREGTGAGDNQVTTSTTDEPASLSELDQLKAQNAALLERLDKMAEGTFTKPEPEPATTAVTEKPAEPAPATTTAPAVKGILEELGVTDIDDVTSDMANFETVLQSVVKRAQTAAVEQVLKSIPQIVSNGVQNAMVTKRVVDSFYEENQELTTVKKTVALLTNEVYAENPDWTLDKVLTEAGQRTRTLLGLQKAATTATTEKASAPSFAGGAGSRTGKVRPQLSKMQEAVNELLED